MQSGRGGGKKGSLCSVKEQEVPARLHTLLGRQMWPSAERAKNVPARERPGSARGRRSRSFGLQRRPRFFQEALPEPPGSRENSSTRRIPEFPRQAPGGHPLQAERRKGAAAPGPYLGTLGLIAAAPLRAAGATKAAAAAAAAGPGTGATGGAGGAGAAGAAAAVPSFHVPFSNVIL